MRSCSSTSEEAAVGWGRYQCLIFFLSSQAVGPQESTSATILAFPIKSSSGIAK